MRTALLAVLLALFGPASGAQACQLYRPPDQMLADGYRQGIISTVAVVRVEEAQHIRPPSGDTHPWLASGRILRVVRGAYPAPTIGIERGWGSAASQEADPLPKAGDRWVVYLWQRADREQAVWVAYPVAVAIQADPSLSRLLPDAR